MTEPVFDPAPLEQLRALQRPGRPDLVGRVLSMFQADAIAKLEELRQSAEQSDDERLLRVAHTLKSTAAQVGAMALRSRCEWIERQAKENPPAARAAVGALAPVVEAAVAAAKAASR